MWNGSISSCRQGEIRSKRINGQRYKVEQKQSRGKESQVLWKTECIPQSIASRSTFSSNNLKSQNDFCMTLSAFHIIIEELWSTLPYSVASVQWGLRAFVYAQLILDFDWAIATPWFFFSFFQSFCCRFDALHQIIVKLHAGKALQ